MSQPVDTAVRKTITVAASQERAFEVFTAQLISWWPKEYSLSETGMADFVIEPKAGGRWYEVGERGEEVDTGRVLAFEPPARLVLAWHLVWDGPTGAGRFDPDPAHASEVEVRFVSEGPTQTRLELEHRHFERHGAAAEGVRAAVDSDEAGWSWCLDFYAKQVAA
jgi:uncharacterized protein YndB with AHSA1/START domain